MRGTTCLSVNLINLVNTLLQVVTQLVIPATKHRQCRLADLDTFVDPADVGTPEYFVSHAWKGRLRYSGREFFLSIALRVP